MKHRSLKPRRATIGSVASLAGLVAVSFSLATTPASATPTSSCRSVLEGETVGTVNLTTLPAGGSVVQAGSQIAIDVDWPTAGWNEELERVIVCVSFDGEQESAYMKAEKPSDNDGAFDHAITLPGALSVGTQVCVRSEVSDEDVDHRSAPVCFTVAAAPTTVVTTPPTTVTPTTQAPVTTTSPATVAPLQLQPTPSAPSTPAPLVELPRTGASLVLLPLGLGMSLGGIVLLLSGRFRRD